MLPAYEMNSFYLIFFLVYMIFGLYFLFSLLMAIIYVNYKLLVEEKKNKLILPREEYFKTLFMNFEKQNPNYLLKDECHLLIKQLVFNLNFEHSD